MESTRRVHALSALARSLSPVAPEELVGVKEIAELAGVARRTAAGYVDREGFPAPVGFLSRGRIWRRADVEAWLEQNPPRGPGRPPKHSSS